ncbi:NIL domain-containing protein [Chloroflexota bacterium]
MISKRIVLHFPKRLLDRPIVYRLIKDYDLRFNILKALVTPEEKGVLVLELTGTKDNYHQGIEYLIRNGVKIQSLSQEIIRNESRCTHCSACVNLCPTFAFEVDLDTRQVKFDNKKCVACGICIKACPPRAMEVSF